MTDATIRAILAAVSRGDTPSDDAAARLIAAFRAAPYEDLGFARVDHHRAVRQGQPEVVFGLGKSTSQVVEISRRIAGRGHALLVTRATPEMGAAVSAELTHCRYDVISRTIVRPPTEPGAPAGALTGAPTSAQPGAQPTVQPAPQAGSKPAEVLVCCAGTADLPVAEEAGVCGEAMGLTVERLYDVGVAGIHRLLDARNRLEAARVLIVVAGMEGALPSVVGGLTAAPVIAVPTSVGYGASFNGLAALLAMLNSCASGIAVMNIDNGFGAAALAARILRSR
ncbi:MAG: nickel pincer cofactor biosynthesis protein LarB [Vicinamibacteraceae bacterium]